ncbi:MAG TPA: SGNH/GDSL hydrolase family protein [Patescibacteria group bacterium]|nr:SGNH/GDSL hydrolase family protein [Patescibacteria group bacterium]
MLFKIWSHLSYFLGDFWLYLVLLLIAFFFLIFFTLKVFKSELSEGKKILLIALVFSMFCLVLIYSGFEAFFRYRYDESDGLGFLNTNVRWMGRHVVDNNYQYRDKNFDINKGKGVIRIGVVGDSLAMGYGIKDVNDRFSNLLEKKLKNHKYNVEVYNFGVAGLDTCSEIKEFERVKNLKFDLIVWEYYLNDIQPCKGSTGAAVVVKSFNAGSPLLKFLRDESFFFDFIYWRLSPAHDQTYTSLRMADLAQFKNKPVYEDHLKNIASFSAELQNETTSHRVVVVVFPFLFLLDQNYPAKKIHKTLDRYFEKNNDTVVDLLPYLMDMNKKNLMVNRFDSHPNELVHALAAKLLYDKIVPIVASLSANQK